MRIDVIVGRTSQGFNYEYLNESHMGQFAFVRVAVDNGVNAGGSRIPSATVLWTAGVTASPVTKLLGTKTDRAGHALVDPFLKVVDAAGGLLAATRRSVIQDGHPVRCVAQAAIQDGRYVGQLIAQEIQGREVARPFRYFDKGSMAVVGKNCGAVARLAPHERLPNVSGLGVHSHPVPAPTTEPPSCATPVALVIFHRPA